ncbi:MAG: mandelate racemase/muconate lactonizing protein [Candidatus Atribacteria bacterium]|nr:mandelate racemase/muconate lactonizing protein [Candidatus Atribacteria bacterium]
MKITNIRCVQLEGTCCIDGKYYEERLVRPIDLYNEFRVAGFTKQDNLPVETNDGEINITGRFLYIDTDENQSGIFGPIALTPAFIAVHMKSLLIGQDPLSTSKLWDLLYRNAVHGRKGETMMAISAIDCALWDLKGKWLNQPVYRLLGGPTREKIPTYISALSYSVEPEMAYKRAKDFYNQGYVGQKWFFRHGLSSGKDGLERNVELVRTIREAVGDDYDLFFDAWMSWDTIYTLEIVKKIKEYNPKWIEEPIMPDKVEQLVEITSKSPILIAGGEHEYTRWGFYNLLKHHALNIIQPDPMWAGGITELTNISNLASVFDIPVIPHGESIASCVHIIASQPPNVCPMVENLEKYNQGWQYFLEKPVTPKNGYIEIDPRPGLGIVIDELKIERQFELTFS